MINQAILDRFLTSKVPMQKRPLNDIPHVILVAVENMNRILNYAGSARPIMVYGKPGTGKSLAIDQLAYHIDELPTMKWRNTSCKSRSVMFLTADALVSFHDNNDDDVKQFILSLNESNEDRHIIIVCNDITIASYLIKSCPNTSIIVEMEQERLQRMLYNDKDNILDRFESVDIDADMEWREAIHEIKKSNEKFAKEYALHAMSDESIRSFAWALMKLIYPSRRSRPSSREHIDIPIGYIIGQVEFAYARSLEKPYHGKRITPLMAKRIAYEGFDNNPYFNDDECDDIEVDGDFDVDGEFHDDTIAKNNVSKVLPYKSPLSLDERLRKQIIHQDSAIEMVAKSILIDAAKLKPMNKPVASFMFIGPSGVGKTQLAKTLSNELYDDPANLIRIDCSEYAERHNVSRLFGPPPGYKGSKNGGLLTNAVREHPNSVILLDEVEKAHPDIWDVFLQVFDDARLTDGQGMTTDFSRCVIIMTGNLGSKNAHRSSAGFGSCIHDDKHAYVDAMKEYFKPEFINRIDGICVFNELDMDDYRRILDIKIRRIEDIINSNYKTSIRIHIHDDALQSILHEGDIKNEGARGFDKVLKERLVLPLADKILTKDIDISKVDVLLVSMVNDKFTIGTEELGEEQA